MKKVLMFLTAMALSSAALASQLTVYADHATVNHGYPAATEEHMLANFNVGSNMLSIEADHLNDWGQTTTFGNIGDTYNFSNGVALSAHFGGSGSGDIAPHTTWGVMGSVKFLSAKNLVASVGYDQVKMRTGEKSGTVNLQAVYYVPGIPLSVQGNYFFVHNKGLDSRNGHRYGMALTYGVVGNWTAGVSYQYGRVNYSLATFLPLAVANYTSSTMSANIRYWVTRSFGVMVEGSRVKNRYYDRNEVGAGVFVDF